MLQIMCQLVSTPIEFAVSHLLIIENQGYSIRRALYLLLKKLVDAAMPGIGGRSRIPFHQQLVAFRLCQKGKLRDALLRRSNNTWKSGFWPRLRSGWSSLTRYSKGTS